MRPGAEWVGYGGSVVGPRGRSWATKFAECLGPLLLCAPMPGVGASSTGMSDFLVNRSDLRDCRVMESRVPELERGQALLRVDRFGLTANNVTYAVFGEMMSYWDFFPAENGWGHVPMWGFAEVERSEAQDVEPGMRLYGYLPPTSYVAVTPADAGADGFVDGSPHRAALPASYQRYLATDADPLYRADTEDLQTLLRPLFTTAFLIDDQLVDDRLTPQGPIVISSASSKTAIGAAYLLSQREEVELIGLTSARNVAFVERLGIYAHTVTYDSIASLDRGPATFVDIAGDPAVRLTVHTHYGEELVYSMTVGATHWQEFGAGGGIGAGGDELPGPSPTFFFAPDRRAKRSEDWGPAELARRISAAWHPFCEWTRSWLEVIHGRGFEAVQRAYLEVLEGRVEANTAHVLTLD
jgi:Protein of unknown function (DUF2855)